MSPERSWTQEAGAAKICSPQVWAQEDGRGGKLRLGTIIVSRKLEVLESVLSGHAQKVRFPGA